MLSASPSLAVLQRFPFPTAARPNQSTHARMKCSRLIAPESSCPTSRPSEYEKYHSTSVRLHLSKTCDAPTTDPVVTSPLKSSTLSGRDPRHNRRFLLKSNPGIVRAIR